MTFMRLFFLFLFFMLLIQACDSRPDYLDKNFSIIKNVKLNDKILYFLDNPHKIAVVDLKENQPVINKVNFDHKIQTFQIYQDKYLAVLDTSGRTLYIYQFEDNNLIHKQYDLPNNYTDILISPDGKYVVAYFGTTDVDEITFKNTSEFSIIDVEKETGEDNPSKLILDLKNLEPQQVVITPEFSVNSAQGMLMLVLTYRTITVVNLKNSKLKPNSITISLSESNVDLYPEKFQYLQSDESHFHVFFKSVNSGDIFQITFEKNKEGGQNNESDFKPSILLHSIGSTPRDYLAFLDQENTMRILALNSTGKVLHEFFPQDGTHLQFSVSDEVDIIKKYISNNKLHFLLADTSVSENYAHKYVTDFDIEESDKKTAKTFLKIPLNSSVVKIDYISSVNKFLLQHPGQSISIFDGEKRNASPFPKTGEIEDYKIIDNYIYFLLSNPWQTVIFDADSFNIEKIEYSLRPYTNNSRLEVIKPVEKFIIIPESNTDGGEFIFVNKQNNIYELIYELDFLLTEEF